MRLPAIRARQMRRNVGAIDSQGAVQRVPPPATPPAPPSNDQLGTRYVQGYAGFSMELIPHVRQVVIGRWAPAYRNVHPLRRRQYPWGGYPHGAPHGGRNFVALPSPSPMRTPYSTGPSCSWAASASLTAVPVSHARTGGQVCARRPVQRCRGGGEPKFLTSCLNPRYPPPPP